MLQYMEGNPADLDESMGGSRLVLRYKSFLWSEGTILYGQPLYRKNSILRCCIFMFDPIFVWLDSSISCDVCSITSLWPNGNVTSEIEIHYRIWKILKVMKLWTTLIKLLGRSGCSTEPPRGFLYIKPSLYFPLKSNQSNFHSWT